MNDILEKIEQLKQKRIEYDYENPEPITSDSISSFEEEFKTFFKIDIDNQFIDFLKECDGLTFNGFRIFSSKNYENKGVPYGIFENNNLFYEQDEEDRQYVLHATSGQDLFVLNKDKNVYQLLDRYSGDDFKDFKDFNDMLMYILKLMLSEDVE